MNPVSAKKFLGNQKFVFVLGAGASKDFGYPVGSELTDQILDLNCSLVMDIFGEGAVKEFQASFRRSGLNSIDLFLERSEKFQNASPHRANYMDIGKYCIARILLEKENESRLLQTHNNWYRFIFNLIQDDSEALTDGRIRFITFNYDISLEHFFYTALLHSRFGFSQTPGEKQAVADIINRLDIIHIYGKLGYLQWQSQEDTVWKYRNYGRFNDIRDKDTKIHFIQKCAEGIHLIRYEENPDMPDTFGHAAGHLCTADHLCFLGFGFDKINMGRLNFENLYENSQHKPKNIFLMGYKFGQAQREMYSNYFHASVRGSIKWSAPEEDIIKYFNNKINIWN